MLPGLRPEISATNSSPVATDLPFTETIVSPVNKPALAAGPFGVTLAMVTPLETPYTRCTAGLGTALNSTPIDPRDTLWSGPINWLYTWTTVFDGMAKPTPWYPPPLV